MAVAVRVVDLMGAYFVVYVRERDAPLLLLRLPWFGYGFTIFPQGLIAIDF
ncbi:hypothetical protein FRC0337_02285 [Corynebacterium diphtheriae]|nr:hypothetical protein CIP107532_02435 [Corynebacterium diphtheriae]CAB0624820.1 hypothetical protein CIP107562_00012 [Corynebacterium diphtheriae]CAB0667436.1 hypothetical protein FRC0016_02156 [Corynebacterium diphtheriae]CAB0783701.1 hypothetical protein FRC0192_00022 [Corynebacterium diphtheriae]CAB0817433.1 hypothetical protein FRC0213_02161 [Corynebacterium diphtheriae]